MEGPKIQKALLIMGVLKPVSLLLLCKTANSEKHISHNWG